MATIDITALDLPPHIHAEVLEGRDVVTGEMLAYPVVWADRTERTCPRCEQPIEVEVPVPVVLDLGADQVLDKSQQHGCGEWLGVDSMVLEPDATAEDVMRLAGQMAEARTAEIDDARAALRRSLRADLRAALKRLVEPLADGETREDREDEVTTGSDMDPGVWKGENGWEAWGCDPDPDSDETDVITVTERDLEG